jgi:uncharacterized repeat protein (TIGR03803 family)
VPILEDALGEDNETVLLSISNPAGGATLGTRTSAPLNILENETVLQLSLAHYSVSETSSKATLTVKRSGDTSTAVSVPYATADGTAQSGLDYVLTSGTLAFPAKATSKTFTVTILQDALAEGPEALSVGLQPPIGGVLGPLSAATLTITDDEPQLYLSAATYTVSEGSAAATITVKRAGNKTSAVSVDYATSDGTASEGADYTAASGTLAFAAGKTSLTFTVPILADGDAEPPETVHLTLSNPVGATLGLLSALLTLTDDEPTVGFSVASFSVSEASASATVTVKRTGSTAGTSQVDYATSDGTAVAGVDYTAASGTLVFPPKSTTQTFTVPILADANAEPTETVNLALSNVSAGTGLNLANATLNITNEDPSISFSMAAYTAKESAKSLMVTVKRTGNVTGAASVDYATSDGTATAGADYLATSGTLSFAAKVTTRTFSVALLPDTLDEGNETIGLTLTNPVGGVLGQDSATIAITDDDDAGVIELAAASFSGSETGGVAVVTVKRSGGTASAASIDYATSDGSAQAGADYTATSGTLTFLAGQTSKTFGIPILADGAPEQTETLIVTLSNPGGGAVLGAQGSAVTYIVNGQLLSFALLYGFGGTTGAFPESRATLGSDGALYGTAPQGGAKGDGVVFKIEKDGSGFVKLHDFDLDDPANGGYPVASLLEGSDGVLYGTTRDGGIHGPDQHGTIFRINKDGTGFVKLHDFQANDPANGSTPLTALVEGSDGILYGTTPLSGASQEGIVYRINKDGSGFVILHDFDIQDPANGSQPWGDLLEGSDGLLYGTTFGGGAGFNRAGTIFRISKNGSGFLKLHDFDRGDPADGDSPYAGLIEGSDGALYGTTSRGGNGGAGIVFRIQKNGTGFSKLHDFAFGDPTSGSEPYAELVEGSNGALFGTTLLGGPYDSGTVFRVNKDGTGFLTLHDFALSNGGYPNARLVEGSPGTYYGTAGGGGPKGAGVLFSLTSAEFLPALAIADASVVEGDAGFLNANFTVTLWPASSQTVTVQYATADGTASAPSDYTSVSGILTFNPLQTVQVVSVPVAGDTDVEPDETFLVNLGNPANAVIADGQGEGTILDDDAVALVPVVER